MKAPLAVVSGGTRGNGWAFTDRLVHMGHDVVLLYHADETAANKAAEAHPGRVHPFRVDITEPRQVDEFADHVLAVHGPPSELVNNAGAAVDKPLLELTDTDWRSVLDINLSGAFHLIRAFAGAMLASGGGVVVNVVATDGFRPTPAGAGQAASKAGLLQLTKSAAIELAPTVRVNALSPGLTDSEEVRTRLRLDDPDRLAGVLAQIPQRRLGSPAELADALEFLVGPASRYLTGQQLVVDGGRLIQ
jgi:acetoacetyl-CoA reductase/3-oxoacyl-[acyl-carrier protein] reductase